MRERTTLKFFRAVGTVLVTVLMPFLLALRLTATPIPVVSISQVVSDSDLVVIGQILSIAKGPNTTKPFMGQNTSGRDLTGRIEIAQVLKGEIPDRFVSFTAFVPDTVAGITRLQTGVPRIFFLRRAEGSWTFASLYRTSTIGHIVQLEEFAEPMQRVSASIAAVVSTRDSSIHDKLQALFDLHGVKDQHVLEVLHSAMNDPDKHVQVSALADLLLVNDLSGFSRSVALFAAPPNEIPEYLLHNLAYSIFIGVSTNKATPELVALMQSPFVEARRAAAHALGKTHDHSAITALTSGLKDADLEVRYESVNSLAGITGQSEWTTDLNSYRRNEEHYLKYWRGWINEHQA